MNNYRMTSIILLLLKQESFITIQDIAEHIGVSNKTIRNDLELLEPWIEKVQLALIKKPGYGIKIEGLPKDKLVAYSTIKKSQISSYPNGPIDRLHFIVLKLSITESYHIHEFAEDLYISHSSIYKDLQSVREFFKKYKLKLNHSRISGLSILGKEKDIRNMMFSVMTQSNEFIKILNIYKNSQYCCTGELIFYGLDLTDDEIKYFIDKTGLRNSDLSKKFALTELGQVIVRIMISYLRNSIGKSIKLSNEFKSKLLNQEFKTEVASILNNLEKNYKIKFSLDEYFYIQVFYLAFLKPENQFPYDIKEIKFFTKYLINEWSRELGINLNKDQKLTNNLITHLIPVYTRVVHDIPINNKLSSNIQEVYPKTLEIVRDSVRHSDKWYSMQDEDIEFLTLHLATALERKKQPLNTLLVYSEGLGILSLLKQRIQRVVHEIKITKVLNYNQLISDSFSNIDLIISTLDLTLDSNLPCIVVNDIMSDHDLLLLRESITDLYKEKNNPNNIN